MQLPATSGTLEAGHIGKACLKSERKGKSKLQIRIQTIQMVLLWTLLSVAALHARTSPDTVRIATAVYLGDVPTIVAEERGFFSEQGIDARISRLASGRQSMAKLRSGEADFALMTLTPLVLDRLADSNPGGPDDPVILAGLLHSSDLLQIVTLSNSGIEQPDDFRGRRIAVDRGTNTEFVWWLYEQFHGIERDSIELVDLSVSEMPDALAAGRVDAAVLWEPHASMLAARLEASSPPGLVHFHVDNLYTGKWIVVTSRRTALERGELCRNLLEAYRKAIDFVDRDPDAAIALFNRSMDFTEGLLADHWNALDYTLSIDWRLIADLQGQFLWARSVGYDKAGGAPRPFNLRLLDLFETGALSDIQPGAVGIPEAEEPNRRP